MMLLASGLGLFLGVHLVPAVPRLRGAVVARLGDNAYRGLFSLVSVAGFVMIIAGKRASGFEYLYMPPEWGRHAALWIMPLATVLIVSAYLPGFLRKAVRHPMMISIALWGVAHLVANGDLASVLLSGGFVAWAVLGLISHLWRERRPAKPAHLWADAAAVALGGATYALLLYLHQLAGVPVW